MAKELFAVTIGCTRVSVEELNGKCYPKATGVVSRELQEAVDKYHGVMVKPEWLIKQLAMLAKKI